METYHGNDNFKLLTWLQREKLMIRFDQVTLLSSKGISASRLLYTVLQKAT